MQDDQGDQAEARKQGPDRHLEKHRVSDETSRATRFLLDRLARLSLSPLSPECPVEDILVAVPESERERVLDVLEALAERKGSGPTSDALAEGSRLVRNAARELWGGEGPNERSEAA
jgi:hypothetical protein